MIDLLAKIISRVLGELGIGVWFVLLFFISGRIEIETGSKWVFLYFFLIVIIPLSFQIIQMKRKKISDIDITKREERYGVTAVFLFFVTLSLVISKIFKAPDIFSDILLIFVINFFFYLLITFFWKISGHALWITNFVLFAHTLVSLWWTWILIPIVWWSRYQLKKHTIWQLLAGSSLATIVFVVVYIFLNPF